MTSARFLFALKLITLVFFLFAFAYKTVTFVDPDLGWHLRAGEIVTQTGTAPMIDPWNYVITDQKWIDHEWLLDLFLWNALTGGYWPVVLLLFFLAAFIPIAIWIFHARSSVQLLFIALATSIIWTIIGVRPQVLSFLLFFFLSEFLFSLENARIKQITYFFLPLLFAFWANIHAGFVAGLILWILVFLTRIYEKIKAEGFAYRHLLNIEFASMIASVGATLLTPYHLTLWSEIITSTTSPLIMYIAEWQTPFQGFDIPFIIFLGGSVAMTIALRKELPLHRLIPMMFFFVSYIQHGRMAPFFLIITIPLLEKIFMLLEKNTKALLVTFHPIFRQTLLFLPAILLCAALAHNGTSSMLREPYHPPYEAINALDRISHQSCNVFNDYGFGGWMIFANPNEKVFIDGRSPHWISQDGISPFKEYVDLIKHPETWEKVFAKHNICVALLLKTDESTIKNNAVAQKPSAWMKIFTKIANLFYPQSSSVPLSLTLKGAGWCEVYTDQSTVILIKPTAPPCARR